MMMHDRKMTPIDPVEFRALLKRARRLCAETAQLRKVSRDIIGETQEMMETCQRRLQRTLG